MSKFSIVVMWICVSVATIGGMYITESAWSLWAFLIPMFVSLLNTDNN